MNGLPILTSSRLKSFRSCQRQHHYRYDLGYRPVSDSETLAFGSLMHDTLEAYWNARRPGATTPPLAAALAQLPGTLDPYVRARAEAMLAGYAVAWDAIECEVLGVEVEFRLPLINPESGAPSRTWQLGGKLDVVVRLADGRTAIIEHKTTSEDASAGSTYRSRLTLDGQVSAYFDGAAALGHVADVCIYDVLVKPKQRPSKATPVEDRQYTQPKSRACKLCGKKTAPPAPHRDEETGTDCVDGRVITDAGGRLYANQRLEDETPEEYRARCVEAIIADPNAYFQRVEVVRLAVERDEYAFDVWQLGRQIREAEIAKRAPRNPDACFRYGTECEFWPVCSGTASIDDVTRYRRVDPEHPHEELAAQSAQQSAA